MTQPAANTTQSSPELRIDPLTGLKTIVASERGNRPAARLACPKRPEVDAQSDPFLEGHERQTPPELYALRADASQPDTPGWTVRVVENLYPALVTGTRGDENPRASVALASENPADTADPLATQQTDPDLFALREATGAHEVVVNAPDPVTSLHDLETSQLEAAMEVWRQRMRAHDDAAYVHVLVNEGIEAGASLHHTHAQLYALSFVPAQIARERERFGAYANRTQGRNLLQDLLQEEVRLKARVVSVDGEAVAICPFASALPFQVQIVPRRPRARFESEGPLASALVKDVLGRLAAALGAVPPLNLWVRTAPRDAESFCWHIEIVPRIARMAGLELGTGVNLNAVAPETAAQRLREVEPAATP